MTNKFLGSQIPRCYDRLGKARRAYRDCEQSNTLEEFVSRWGEMLVHGAGVLHAIEAGVKHSPQGRQWYGGIKARHRNDELLRYMYQARNEEEHGSNSTTQQMNFPAAWRNDQTGKLESIFSIKDAGTSRRLVLGPWSRTGPILSSITDSRYSDVFLAPTTHKGKPLSSNEPLHVAALWLNALEELVREACELC